MNKSAKVVRMQSPPSCFWNCISLEEWGSMSDQEQDTIVEAAKIVFNRCSVDGFFHVHPVHSSIQRTKNIADE